jgi:hypothetical protein
MQPQSERVKNTSGPFRPFTILEAAQIENFTPRGAETKLGMCGCSAQETAGHYRGFALRGNTGKAPAAQEIAMIDTIDMIRLAVRPCGQSPRFTTE